MKNQSKPFISILLLSLWLISSCNPKTQSSHEQSLRGYFCALNEQDFGRLSNFISDSLKTFEMGYLLTGNKEEFYTQFQWDSVFQPEYQMRDIRCGKDSAELIVSKNCQRIAFLQDSALEYRALVVFAGDQIKEISTIGYLSMDFALWQARRDSLIEWIDREHPALSGFAWNLSPKGAGNYLKAIELWRNEK